MKSNWKRVGTIGVDSGQMMLVDPCYVLRDSRRENEKGADYNDLLDAYGDDYSRDTLEFSNGIVSSTGFGDGSYDVFIKTSDEGDWGNRVAEMKIVFIEDVVYCGECNEDENNCLCCGSCCYYPCECDLCYCGSGEEADLCTCEEEDDDLYS